MKELYGIDVTTVKNNDDFDSVSYETKKISEEKREEIDSAVIDAYAADEKAELPLALRIARWICAALVLVTVAGIIRNIGDLSLSQMFKNAPWLFVSALITGLAWIVLTVLAQRKKKEFESSGELEKVSEDVNGVMEESRRMLSIPDGAVNIDAFTYKYKSKEGENKIIETLMGHYMTVSNYVFVENGCFCIADAYSRFDIRFSDLKSIDIVNKRMYMSEWIKEEPFTDEAYKDFVYPKEDNLGRIWLRSYCVLRFTLQGDEFAFRFPTYELATIQSLTGLRAENAE
ncbi:MAG: hypothetical protein K6G56_06105 [Clostridiales bacterium]|nr:hypothetical protein [Clostridiales bacterium]